MTKLAMITRLCGSCKANDYVYGGDEGASNRSSRFFSADAGSSTTPVLVKVVNASARRRR